VIVGVACGTAAFTDREFHKCGASLLGRRKATARAFGEGFAALPAGPVGADGVNGRRATLSEAPDRFPKRIRLETSVFKAIIEI
jgi:hypothetical protein